MLVGGAFPAEEAPPITVRLPHHVLLEGVVEKHRLAILTVALPLVLAEQLDAHRESVPGPMVLELEGDALPSGQRERGAPLSEYRRVQYTVVSLERREEKIEYFHQGVVLVQVPSTLRKASWDSENTYILQS